MSAAPEESRAFWLAQQMHAPPFCSQQLRAALRLLEQSGACPAGSTSGTMARTLVDGVAAGRDAAAVAMGHGDGGDGGDGSGAVRLALELLGRVPLPGLSATAAAKQLGYVDCHATGNFIVGAEGSMVKVHARQWPSSAPAPPQGAPGGSGRLGTPRGRGQATGRPATASGARASRL